MRHLRRSGLIVFVLAMLLLVPTATASSGWVKTYAGIDMDILNPTSIVETTDGGFATAVSGTLKRIDNIGYQGHFTETYELQIMKLDSNGQIQWKRGYATFDDPNDSVTPLSTYSEKYSIVQTPDGGYAVAGSSTYRGWLIKTDSQGTLLWTKSYTNNEESESNCYFYDMTLSNDGGFAIAGTTLTFAGAEDFWLIKTDSKGIVQWQQLYNSANYVDSNGNQVPQSERAMSVIQTRDGGYAVSGSVSLYKASTGSFVSATWVVKTDAQGKLSWSKGYDLLNWAGFPQTIIQTLDGGYAVAGTENENFCLIKITSSGQMQWSKTYEDERTNFLSSLVQLNDGGYALAGTGTAVTSTISLLRVDSSGQTTWIKTFNNSAVTSNDFASAMILGNDGSYVLTGSTTIQSGTHQDILIVKTEQLEEPPTATPTVIHATSEPLSPDATFSPSATSTQPSNTNYPDNTDNPNNSQDSNSNIENALNSSATWIGLAAIIIVAVIVTSALIFLKKSKKRKST